MNPETVNDVLAYNPQQVLFSHFTLPTERVYKSTYLWSKLALAGYILRAIGDGMEMAHSIEGRPPFLDHELFSICSGLQWQIRSTMV